MFSVDMGTLHVVSMSHTGKLYSLFFLASWLISYMLQDIVFQLFLFLFHEKQYKPPTVAVYRVALRTYCFVTFSYPRTLV